MFENFFDSICLEKPTEYEGTVVFPITLEGYDNELQYMVLEEALEKKMLKITEVSKEASVPVLKAMNNAPVPVLILDGEGLEGARQNRVINTSILIPEESELIIPVSCTEKKRWHYNSPEFDLSENIMPQEIRAKKNEDILFCLSTDRTFKADQGKLWDEIDKLHFRSGTLKSSHTGALDDALKKSGRKLRKQLYRFKITDQQQGILVMKNNEVSALEVIPNPHAYKKLHGKLLKSYLLGKNDDKWSSGKTETKDPWTIAHRFVHQCKKMPHREFKSLGYGYDHRFMHEGRIGSLLVNKEEVIHGVFSKIN